MPRIAEIRPLDGTGDIWVKLDSDYLETDGPITLYTEKELEAFRHSVARDAALAILELIFQRFPDIK